MTKIQFRKASIANLKSSCRDFDTHILSKIILTLVEDLKKKIIKKEKLKILSYMHTEIELNIDFLCNINEDIYLPKLNDNDTFNCIKYENNLIKNRFNILEPKENIKEKEENKFDIAFIPIVGIDKAYRRIGRGKGMYDKCFTKTKATKKIFVTKHLQYIDNVITNKNDIKGDILINGYEIKYL